MKTALTFDEKKDVKQLDILSALIVILFTFFILLFYSFPFMQTIKGFIVPNASASVQIISSQ